MVVILVPLVFAQWSYLQQRAEAISHERTVASLVAAVDAREPARRGRNQQVAAVCELIGDRLRLTPSQFEALHFAALLHDVGMISPAPDRREGRPQPLPDDLDRIRRHPDRSVEMLASIAFLADSISAIQAHHERWDGRGYPGGVRGPAIPLLARILAVADTVCALVSADPAGGVDAAVEQVRARAGSQFDPECVAALGQVTADVRRALCGEGGRRPAARTPLVWDHDLPSASDLLASRAPAHG
nr:HD domain-containing phosphohydrolase [Flexivirga meconopsidis]